MTALHALLMLALGAAPAAQDDGVRIRVECREKRLNPARPMKMTFVIENRSTGERRAEEPADWTAGLEIRDAKDNIIHAPAASEAKREHVLDAGGFVGRSVDIAPLLKGRTYDEGFFTFAWSWKGLKSDEIRALVLRDYRVQMETNFGDMVLDLDPDAAPNHVLNFVTLVRQGFYDGLKFHRIIPEFVVQGGEPAVEPNLKLKAEFNDRRHVFGTLSMARAADPDSASTQFFLCLESLTELDGKYTVFGKLREGESVLREIGRVKTDHNPCGRCGKALPDRITEHCGQHHKDKPVNDVVMKKLTLIEIKD